MKRRIYHLILLVLFFLQTSACHHIPSTQPSISPASPKYQTEFVPATAAPLNQFNYLHGPSPTVAQITHGTNPTVTPLKTPTTLTVVPREYTCPKAGTIVQANFPTDQLPQPLEYHIYLPPCYADNVLEHYAVLYLIHGQSYTDDQWVRLGAPLVADRLIATNQIPPIIIVMPRDRIWEQPREDYFGDVLVHQLIPYIDAHYRTIAERDQRALGGLSRGAGWAVHLGLQNWQEFSKIGAHSLAVFPQDVQTIPKWLDQIPKSERPAFFLDIGRQDRPEMLKWTFWFEQLLTEKHYVHEWYYYTGFHDEAYWSAHIEQYLRWYAQNWGNE
ncbi:MAG: alpha/beta hydrolase [Anaerolineales bacterium]